MSFSKNLLKSSQNFGSLVRSLKITLPYLLHAKAEHLQKEVTEQYPDPVFSRSKEDLPTRFRGALVNDILKCSGCGDCQKVCPTQAIQIESKNIKEISREWVSKFDIDLSRCIFCGLCTDVCEPQSLTHSKEFEIDSFSKSDLVVRFGRGELSDEKMARTLIVKKERRSW